MTDLIAMLKHIRHNTHSSLCPTGVNSYEECECAVDEKNAIIDAIIADLKYKVLVPIETVEAAAFICDDNAYRGGVADKLRNCLRQGAES